MIPAAAMNNESAPPWMRTLPTGQQVSALGFGASSMWAKPHFPEARARAVFEAAVESGINHFDTGPSYGPGTGEERLGRFLRDHDPGRMVIATKVGTNFVDGKVVRSFDPNMLERSFDGSMARLGLERVDILYLHGPSVEDLDHPVFDFLDRLKRTGRIGLAAVNSFTPAVLDKVAATPVDGVMLQYNVGDLSLEPNITALAKAGKFVMSGTALGRAKFRLATFIPKSRAQLWYLARMLKQEPDFLWRGQQLARKLRATGKPPLDAALQFVVEAPELVSNLFGTTSPSHVRENVRAARGTLGAEAWQSLHARLQS